MQRQADGGDVRLQLLGRDGGLGLDALHVGLRVADAHLHPEPFRQRGVDAAEVGPAAADGTSPDYGLPPQPYVPHPSSYQETGVVGEPKTWTINVLEGTTLVYGGFSVNDETDGVYGAIAGPTTVSLTVTDGFYSIVLSEWAKEEYCFRLGEAIKYGWAYANLHPLDGWSCSD